mgnify:CR=1 FL=1
MKQFNKLLLASFFLIPFMLFADDLKDDILSMRERAKVRDTLLKDRFESVLPNIMRRNNIDMWLIIAREYNEDPVIRTMLPATWLNARRRTVLVIFDPGNNKPLETYAVARYAVGEIFKKAWDPEAQPDQYKALADLIKKKNPKKIGINKSEFFAQADGLSSTEYDLLNKALPRKYQKKIVNVANKKGIPVIVATQMLDSMIKNPRPTFAEITDVANGVLEGVDGVMLSGEVAVGKYPIRCIENMISIIEIIEKSFQIKTNKNISINSPSWENHTAIAKTACETAQTLNAKLIVCLTLTGSIAKIISSWRPKATILAISPRANVIQNLCFYWGVHGIRNPLFYATDSLLQDIPNLLKNIGLVEKNDTIIITAGIPLKDMCPTNMIKINKIS